MVSPDKLIPPDSELAHLLLQWTETQDTRTWNVANLTNELIEELEGEAVTKADVYRAVATRCKGKKPNTIRRWAEVAADYDKDAQDKYAQLLSFDHFKTARRLWQEGHTPYLAYALEWCVEGNDDKTSAGRFHTVGDMLNQFLPEYRDTNPLLRYWTKIRDKLYDLMLIEDNDVKRYHMLENWKEIDDVIRSLELDKSEEVD